MKKIIIAVMIMAFSVASFASGEVLKLNTKGKQYCSWLPPTSFNSKNDVDLWLWVVSPTLAEIYADQGLTMLVATLDMQTATASPTKLSFSAFSGNSSNHLSAVGVFALDKLGEIKSVNATLIRRGVINSCYSNAVVSGKRVL